MVVVGGATQKVVPLSLPDLSTRQVPSRKGKLYLPPPPLWLLTPQNSVLRHPSAATRVWLYRKDQYTCQTLKDILTVPSPLSALDFSSADQGISLPKNLLGLDFSSITQGAWMCRRHEKGEWREKSWQRRLKSPYRQVTASSRKAKCRSTLRNGTSYNNQQVTTLQHTNSLQAVLWEPNRFLWGRTTG